MKTSSMSLVVCLLAMAGVSGLLSGCSTAEPGEPDVVEVVDGKPISATAASPERTAETRTASTRPAAASLRVEDKAPVSLQRQIAPDNAARLARALEAEPADVVHGSVTATPR
jgi:hypothetical protein